MNTSNSNMSKKTAQMRAVRAKSGNAKIILVFAVVLTALAVFLFQRLFFSDQFVSGEERINESIAGELSESSKLVIQTQASLKNESADLAMLSEEPVIKPQYTFQEKQESVLQQIESVHQLTKTSLAKSTFYQDYQDCMQRVADGFETSPSVCQPVLSDALYETMDLYLNPALMEKGLDISFFDNVEDADLANILDEIFTNASDPIERVSALLLVRHARETSKTPLPFSAYKGLENKTVIEAQLLLMQLAHISSSESPQEPSQIILGSDSDVAALKSSMRALITSPEADTRLSSIALLSLGRHQDLDNLNDVVLDLNLTKDNSWSGWNNQVAPSLGFCGIHCYDITRSLLTTKTDPEFIVGVLMTTPYEERQELYAAVEGVLPESTINIIRENVDL